MNLEYEQFRGKIMYENAKATAMLATHCACCSKPLLDVQSVEIGMGPVCRKKYAVEDISEVAREEGNKLVYMIAKYQKGEQVDKAVARLKELGFSKLVERINKRLRKRPSVKIDYNKDRMQLKAYIPVDMWQNWIAALRQVPGRKYEGSGLNSFPISRKREVYQLLCEFLPGKAGVGPKGDFIIPI